MAKMQGRHLFPSMFKESGDAIDQRHYLHGQAKLIITVASSPKKNILLLFPQQLRQGLVDGGHMPDPPWYGLLGWNWRSIPNERVVPKYQATLPLLMRPPFGTTTRAPFSRGSSQPRPDFPEGLGKTKKRLKSTKKAWADTK